MEQNSEHSMHTASSILVCGQNSELLRTRGLVLESAGYRVETALGSMAEVTGLSTIKVAVLCHTLSEADQQMTLALLARHAPHARALCLVPAAGSVPSGTESLDSFQGPRKLLEVVNRLFIA